jgi:uncharacterized membrane protein
MSEELNTATSATPTITAPAKQSRWKSKVLWASIVAQILAVLQLSGIFTKLGLDSGYIGNIIASVLQLLVIVGVLNDPTNSEGF